MATKDATRTAAPALSAEALEALRMQLRGPSARPGEPACADVRPAFNTMHRGEPALTITCSGTADVVDAVNFAREQGLPVAVRGGGHSVAGLSHIDGGVLIDLAQMRGVHVDPAARTALVQGGALWGDVDRETQAFGLVAPGGVVSDTGVGGLTLGGGYGWLRRMHGLSCDHVAEAQVVCADGTVRRAAADENADLYWAIRGGGGNFGIVTSFTFDLVECGPMVAFAGVMYPLEDIASVMRGWRDYVEQAPNEVTSVCVSITFPADPEMPPDVHDRPLAIVGGVHAGRDVDEGLRVLQPLRELGAPILDISGPTPYVGVNSSFDPLFPRDTLSAYWKSQYLEALPDEAIDVIAARANDRPSPLTLVNTFHMGGAIADVGPQDTAFAERSAPSRGSIDGMWPDPADDAANIAWVREAWEEVKPFGNGGVYLNFTGLAGEDDLSAGVDTAFGRTLARLTEVKAKYDPQNFFAYNNNIVPAQT
jgi:hypothetical protein